MRRVLMKLRRHGGISCARVQDLVQSYLDGELGEPERSQLSTHLDRCPGCGIEAAVYEQIRTALRAEPSPEAVDRLTRFASTIGEGQPPQA